MPSIPRLKMDREHDDEVGSDDMRYEKPSLKMDMRLKMQEAKMYADEAKDDMRQKPSLKMI